MAGVEKLSRVHAKQHKPSDMTDHYALNDGHLVLMGDKLQTFWENQFRSLQLTEQFLSRVPKRPRMTYGRKKLSKRRRLTERPLTSPNRLIILGGAANSSGGTASPAASRKRAAIDSRADSGKKARRSASPIPPRKPKARRSKRSKNSRKRASRSKSKSSQWPTTEFAHHAPPLGFLALKLLSKLLVFNSSTLAISERVNCLFKKFLNFFNLIYFVKFYLICARGFVPLARPYYMDANFTLFNLKFLILSSGLYFERSLWFIDVWFFQNPSCLRHAATSLRSYAILET